MKDVKKFLKEPNNDSPHIIAVADNEEDPIFKLFIEANNDVRDEYSFGHTFAKDAKKYFGIKKSAIILVHPEHLQSKYESKQHVFKVCFEIMIYLRYFPVLITEFSVRGVNNITHIFYHYTFCETFDFCFSKRCSTLK